MEKTEEVSSFLSMGPWFFEAAVETRGPDAYGLKTTEISAGDLWYRIVISVSCDDGTGETGLHGELTTPWLYSLAEAKKQSRLLRGMALAWAEYSDEQDEYLPQESHAKFDAIVDHAIERFTRALPSAV